MPSVSKAQRRFLAMCEHGESTRGDCPDMSRQQYRDFTRTSEKHLPYRAKRKNRRGRR